MDIRGIPLYTSSLNKCKGVIPNLKIILIVKINIKVFILLLLDL